MGLFDLEPTTLFENRLEISLLLSFVDANEKNEWVILVRRLFLTLHFGHYSIFTFSYFVSFEGERFPPSSSLQLSTYSSRGDQSCRLSINRLVWLLR
jgi:hypothetical protein